MVIQAFLDKCVGRDRTAADMTGWLVGWLAAGLTGWRVGGWSDWLVGWHVWGGCVE